MADSKNKDTLKKSQPESFVGRWSRRKLTPKQTDNKVASTFADDQPNAELSVPAEIAEEVVAQEAAAEIPNAPSTTADVPAKNHAASESEQEEPVLTDEDMPGIETLNAQSDVSPFFNKGVSEALRKAALRHIFSLPSYNIRDGLNDYDDDYTVFEPLGDTVTSDMRYHAARKEREREEREREEQLERERLEQEQQEQEAKPLEAEEHEADELEATEQENEHLIATAETEQQESLADENAQAEVLENSEAINPREQKPADSTDESVGHATNKHATNKDDSDLEHA